MRCNELRRIARAKGYRDFGEDPRLHFVDDVRVTEESGERIAEIYAKMVLSRLGRRGPHK